MLGWPLLKHILSQPSAPFREDAVKELIRREFRARRRPFFEDEVGNLFLGVPSVNVLEQRLRSTRREPLKIFTAHMDHPGFHGVRWVSDRRLSFRWHGGAPRQRLVGARLWISNGGDFSAEARIVATKQVGKKRYLDGGVLELTRAPAGDRPEAKALFGGFGFRAPVWRDGTRIYTKAADDLAGAFVVAETLLRGTNPDTIGLLTRAEEVGFMGALAQFRHRRWSRRKRDVLFVSLECSRTLPGADIGAGPVVRLGDRTTVFDPTSLQALLECARRTLGKRHQARVMNGGTCEATTALAMGIPAVGVSMPLGNYHNESFEGGPDSRGPRGPAPEFIDWRDVQGALKLCAAFAKTSLTRDPWQKQRDEMFKDFRRLESLL